MYDSSIKMGVRRVSFSFGLLDCTRSDPFQVNKSKTAHDMTMELAALVVVPDQAIFGPCYSTWQRPFSRHVNKDAWSETNICHCLVFCLCAAEYCRFSILLCYHWPYERPMDVWQHSTVSIVRWSYLSASIVRWPAFNSPHQQITCVPQDVAALNY